MNKFIILLAVLLGFIISTTSFAKHCLCEDKHGNNKIIIYDYQGKHCKDIIKKAKDSAEVVALFATGQSPAQWQSCNNPGGVLGDKFACKYTFYRVHLAKCTDKDL